MIIRAKLSALKQGHWYEYLVRFVLGGFATVVAGVVADIRGPAAGGLFLAFPAIFCASATLIEKHEREEKEKKGLKGKERGKDAAALDAAGTALGSAGLAAFGAVMWLLATDPAVGSLALATAIWFVVSVLLWRVRRELRSTEHETRNRLYGTGSTNLRYRRQKQAQVNRQLALRALLRSASVDFEHHPANRVGLSPTV